MSEKVELVSLSECISKIIDYRGKTPKKLGGEWSEIGYRAISANNVKVSGLVNIESIKCLNDELYSKWMTEEVEKGDLLLTSEAPSGQVLIWNTSEKIVLSQRLFCLRTNEQTHNYYLKYYLQSEIGQSEITRNNSGSTVQGISAKMFDYIKIIRPQLPIQQKIASVLSSLDDKIELNNKINDNLPN